MLLLIHIKAAIKLLIKEGNCREEVQILKECNCREVQILVGWSLVPDQGLLMDLAIKLQVKGWANNNTTTWVLEGFHSMAPRRRQLHMDFKTVQEGIKSNKVAQLQLVLWLLELELLVLLDHMVVTTLDIMANRLQLLQIINPPRILEQERSSSSSSNNLVETIWRIRNLVQQAPPNLLHLELVAILLTIPALVSKSNSQTTTQLVMLQVKTTQLELLILLQASYNQMELEKEHQQQQHQLLLVLLLKQLELGMEVQCQILECQVVMGWQVMLGRRSLEVW
jgi:hypothetical protein